MNAPNFSALIAVLLFTGTGRADPLDTWTWRNPLPTGNALHSIGYGNGLFVAVGAFGTIVTSTDGGNWTLRQWSGDSTLSGIAYGNGQFVAVGYSDTDGSEAILTSTDGVDWVQHPQGTNNFHANSITFGNGQFVAVGFGTIVTSANGVTWKEQRLGMPYGLSGIAHGNGQFVAVGSLGTNSTILTSADGVNWIQRQLGTQYGGNNGVAYGDGQFVAVGNVDAGMNSAVILTSADGVNWVQRQAGTSAYSYLSGIAYGNGQFVAVGEYGKTITSSDGVNWLQRQAGTQNALFGIAYGNGQFVAVGDGGAILVSANMTNWVQRRSGSPDQLNGIAYGNGQFVAVGQVNTPDTTGVNVTPSILTSTDGVAWVRRESGLTSGFLSGVAYGSGQFVAVGAADVTTVGGDIILTSLDGVAWTRRQKEGTTDGGWVGVAYGNGQFVAVGAFGTIVTSTDGGNWTLRQWSGDSTLSGIAYGNGQFVAAGQFLTSSNHDAFVTPTILTSTDGVEWVQRHPKLAETSIGLSGVAYGNGQFVAVGGLSGPDLFSTSGTIVTSADGVNWVQRQPGLSETPWALSGIAYGNGQFVAVGPRGIVTSADGVNWIQRRGGFPIAIAYGNGHFVAVGQGGMILESGSIINLSIMHNAGTGLLKLSLEGPTGLAYAIQSSTNLISWRNLTNITSAQPSTIILNALPPASDRVFYRAYSQ